MTKINKIGFTIIFSMLVAVVLCNFSATTAKASSIPLQEYRIAFNGTPQNADIEYNMIRPEVSLTVSSKDIIPAGTTVVWSSSEPGVVTIDPLTSSSTNAVKMIRNGPGYSTITATITQGGVTLPTVQCTVKVDLEFNYADTGMVYETTTSKVGILILDTIGEEKSIFLKYVDYEDTPAVPVSGAAVIGDVLWESSNTGVATVNVDGEVEAVGSGVTTITVTSNTMSSQDKPMRITMKVVVKPSFTLDFSTSSDPVESASSHNTPVIVQGVPSTFILESRAELASTLKWEIYDCSTNPKRKILPDTTGPTSKMTYSIHESSGSVEFRNVKAGTYEIYAFADEAYNVNTKAPYAYMKVVVPIDIRNRNIVMSIGDTYSVIGNSNIPVAGIFGYVYTAGNTTIATYNENSSIITANEKGNVTLRLTYRPSYNLFDTTLPITFDINITVIDAIALSTSNAKIYTKGTLLLNATVTDPGQPITWLSSAPLIASVDGGLVTGLKPGVATITASQILQGVEKKVTCQITVTQSVETIVMDPVAYTLPIGQLTTLHAIVTPSGLVNVTLKWVSSDTNIVEVVDINPLTATIRGVAGGHAVISAINQDNVVVGYCHVSVQQPVTDIVLSETEATVTLSNSRLQLRATALPVNALNKTIIWSSSDETKARVDANGLVTVLRPGTVSIIATSQDSPSIRKICNINIQVPVVSVTLDEKTKTMYVGQAHRLTYLILPMNASTNTVTWTSTNTSVATVDNTGKVSAKGVGTTVIILKTLDGGFSVYSTITVKRVATGVKFDVTELALKTGESYQLKTTITPKDSTDNGLVWESSDTKVAVVDEDGKIEAREAGTAIIMARTESGGVTYCKLTVTQAVNGLLMNFSEKTIYVGSKFKLKVSVSPSTATKLSVTWKSSNPKIATVSEEGEVSGLLGGVTIITCTTVDGGYVASCVLTVRETVTTVKFDYDTFNIGVNKTAKLIATVSTETATNQEVTYSSSNDKIVTVNQKGKITGIKLGYATITATAKDGSEVEATCEVRVVIPASSVTLSKSNLTMYVGDDKTLKASIKPSNSTYKKAKWSSSDVSVAIVDDDGTIIAIKAGNTVITAEANDNTGKKDICYVTVYNRLPSTGITLQDKKLNMIPGEEKIVQVVLAPAAATDSVTWSTDNAAIAKVDKKTGKITARNTGTAYVTAMTDSGKTAVIEVSVIGLNVTKLITEEYTTYNNALEVYGVTGNVTYRIDNPMIAVVYNDGTVSTRGVGTATITITVNGRKLKCKLIVNRMPKSSSLSRRK